MERSTPGLSDFLSDDSSSQGAAQAGATLGTFLDQSEPKRAPARVRASTTSSGGAISNIDEILAQEGAQAIKPVVEAIYAQESSSGRNARMSVDGAMGGMQVIPATFKRYAREGERIDDPVDNMRVGIRYLKDLASKFGNDPAKLAAGYFSGEGNVNPGKGQAWKEDRADGNGKKVSAYVADLVARVSGSQPAMAAAPGARPDLTKAPKWADVVAKPEFKALPPEKQAEAKAAYFDYWIAPNAGDQAASLREQFMAAQDAQPGLLDRAMGALKGAFTAEPSVLEQRPAEAPKRSSLPVSENVRAAFNAAWDASTPEQRKLMEGAPGWKGILARERAQAYAGPLSETGRLFDTRVESRAQRLVGQGEDARFAETAARQAAARGVAPGQEIRALGGTVQPSGYDFDTKAAFDPNAERNGLNNTLARGVAKGGLGVSKAITGYTQFLADVLGADEAAKVMRQGGDWARGKEQAIGERGTFLDRNMEGAISSISQQLPLLLGGAAAASELLPLAGMAFQSFGQEYSDGRAAGQDTKQATARAAAFAAFEVIGEKFGLKESLQAIKGAAKGLPSDQLIGFLWNALKKEVPGELLTTTGQFGVDKLPGGVGLNPNAGGAEYLQQVADTIAQTIMQSGMMAGGTTGVSRAVRYMADKPTDVPVAPRVEPVLGAQVQTGQPAADPVMSSTMPDLHPMVQEADQIVRELAQAAGIPESTVLPEPAPAPVVVAQPEAAPAPAVEQTAGQDDALTDQDVVDFATGRLEQLRAKRDGQIQTVVEDTGMQDVEVPGVVLSQTEQQELAAIEQSGGNPDALRTLYGLGTQPGETDDEREARLEREAIQAEAAAAPTVAAQDDDIQADFGPGAAQPDQAPERPQPKTEKEARAQRDYSDKWFGTAEKAQAFIDKQAIGASHEVVPDGKRFLIQKKGTTNGAQAAQAQQAEPAAPVVQEAADPRGDQPSGAAEPGAGVPDTGRAGGVQADGVSGEAARPDLDAMFDEVLAEEVAKDRAKDPAQDPVQNKWSESAPAQRREMLAAAGYTDGDQARALSGMEWDGLSETVRDALVKPKTEKEAKARRAAQAAPVQGTVGMKLQGGQVVLTASGRQTTPFPNLNTETNRKALNTMKAVDSWLMSNALAEAESRGDEFNAGWMRQAQAKPSPAEKDSAEEYLFGQQPPVVPSILKPLGSAAKNTAAGLNAAIDGLGALFGGKPGQLNSGIGFDAETYAKAKPLFQQAIANLGDAGTDLKEAMRIVVRMVLDKFGAQAAQNMKPYVVRFVEEISTADTPNKAIATQDATAQNQEQTSEQPDASPAQPADVPSRDPREAAADEPVGNRDRQPVGTGVAADGQSPVQERGVPAGAADAGGAGARGDQSAGDDASGPARDRAGVRPEPVAAGADDHVIDAEEIGKGGLTKKYRDNVAAIKLLKALEADGRKATADERKVLARYAGWGALKGPFDPENKQWAKQHAELKELLTADEFKAARASTLNAHYTSPVAVAAMYEALQRMGVKGGRMLEPSVGSGNFFGLMPAALRQAAQLYGVELDSLTSRLVAALYPRAKIAKATGFEAYDVPGGFFDVVIGNPPFGNETLTDADRSPYSGFSIHNYFLAKGIDKLRPGGVMAVVVSHSFLDAQDGRARKWIGERADLIAAARLPNTAFKENAGTEVVTDILVFQKRDGAAAANGIGNDLAPWQDTVDQVNVNTKTGETVTHRVNQLFTARPDLVLGKPAASGTMYRPNEYTVEADGDLAKRLDTWAKSVPAGVFHTIDRSSDAAVTAMAVPDGVKVGSFYVDTTGKVMRRTEDLMGEKQAVEWVPKTESQVARMRGMIGLRETLRKQMRLERSPDATDQEIEENRAELNRLYDDFLKKFKHVNSTTNRAIFLDDTEAHLIQALEFDYDKGVGKATAEREGIDPREPSAVKADIFKRRVAFPSRDFMTVQSAKDALLASLNFRGGVDGAYMEQVYGKPMAEIVKELGDVVFEDPQAGIVTADEYLSGDVKTKLDEAKAAATDDARFKRNVEALQKVIPKDKTPSEISVSIGAAFVPAEIYEQFVQHISGGTASAAYVKATGQWLVQFTGTPDQALNAGRLGTSDLSAQDLFQLTMQGRGAVVKTTYKNPDGSTTTVVLEKETEAAREKQSAIKAEWQKWLWQDPARAERIASIYNEKMNRIVLRQFDGSHLTFPGMNPAIGLLAHQKNGVWRGLQSRRVLYDHVVGAGKTFEMATLAMEMRRLGMARKPLFVVPNHLTLQWRSEFTRLYPGSNILAATPEDFSKDNRERLFSKIITGDWDAVVIGHSSLKKIGLPAETETGVLQEQIEELATAIEDMKRARGDRRIVGDMERIRKNLESKMKEKLAAVGTRSNVVTFDELGIDAMFVDEMHEFKNLTYNTTMDRNPGMGNPAGSAKAFDMFVKVRWLYDHFADKTIFVTATGTPVSNSLVEMFNMQRYMQYPELKSQDLHVFDAWAKQFGSVENVYEVAPSGSGYRQSTRFAKFTNLPALMGLYNSFADTITLDDLRAQEEAQGKRFPVPNVQGGRPTLVVAKRSPAVAALMGVPKAQVNEQGEVEFEADLSRDVEITFDAKAQKWDLKVGGAPLGAFDTEQDARMKLVEKAMTPVVRVAPESILGRFANLRQLTKETKGKVNALSLTGEANKAGLDYRLIDPGAPDFAGSKINLAVDRMMEVYRKWAGDKGTQLVFCDLSIPMSARASFSNKARRLYVRGENGVIEMKRGTLHAVPGHEDLPFFVVQRGDKDAKRFDVYDAASGMLLKRDHRAKADAVESVAAILANEEKRSKWITAREATGEIDQTAIDEYNNDNDIEVEDPALFFTREDVAGMSGSAAFSVYDDIKAKLIAKGVPEREIAFIHDYQTPTAKDKLFKAVNAGEIRFLLGSTPKMGAGTNVQQRLVGLHHIDAPWRPSDLEQREGRIIRRGNKLYERDPEGFEVFIGRYATEQTYDTRRWQILEHKARGIEQLRNFDGSINEIDDIEGEAANAADMKAAASGDPLILEETKLRNDVRRLEQLQAGHADEVVAMTRRARQADDFATQAGPAKLAQLADLLGKAKANPLDKDGFAPVTVAGQGRSVDKEAAQKALAAGFTRVRNNMTNRLEISFRGIDFAFETDFGNVVLRTPTGRAGEWAPSETFSPSGALQRLKNYVDRLAALEDDVRENIEKAKRDAVALREQAAQPFVQAAQLESAREEHKKVQRALMAKGPEVPQEQKTLVRDAMDGQKVKLRDLGFEDALNEFMGSGNALQLARAGRYTAADEPSIPDNSPDTQRAIEALKRGLGGTFLDEDRLSGEWTDSLQQLLPVAAAFGTRIVGFKVRPAKNPTKSDRVGSFDGVRFKDVTYLNVESTRPHLALLGHEIAHQMRKDRPDLYQRLVDGVAPFVKVREYETKFRGSTIAPSTLEPDAQREEFMGEVLSDGFMEPEFWYALGRKNKQLLAQVQTFIGRILDKVFRTIGYKKRTTEYLTDYARVMQIAGEVMADFGLSQERLNKAAGIDMAFQRAFHGTPHRGIDKFSTDKIGTGEGAQAYGWGLYFASKREVADWYREHLSGAENGKRLELADGGTATERKAAEVIADYFADSDFADLAEIGPDALAAWADEFLADDPGRADVAKAIRTMDTSRLVAPKGKVYEVEIPEDSEMLLWDKPLSEQPQKVREALGRLGFRTEGNKGSYFYERLSDMEGGDKQASEALAAAGIKGIKYLDGGSQGATGPGWRIRLKNGKYAAKVFSSKAEAQAAAADPRQYNNVDDVQYMEDGSYNYVIFSGDDVQIEVAYFSRSDTIDVDGKQRPTTNSDGQPIHPAEEGVRNFWRWFGDSKVVDDQGRPLVVYHGTDADFSVFETKKARAGRWGKGFYFAETPGRAKSYGKNIIPAYLRMESPMSRSGTSDGVIVGQSGERIYAVWEPTQIKSATGNTGTFAPDNADLRFARSDDGDEDTGPGFSDVARRVRSNVVQFFGSREGSLKTFGAYDRTLSTQFNKALKDKHYGKVFGYVNAMQNEVSLTSLRPAELAPGVLPRVDDVRSAAKMLVKGKRADTNLTAAADAVFAGTLNGGTVLAGKVWSKDEFTARFGSKAKDAEAAWGLYQQTRAAIDASLDEVAAAEAYALVQGIVPKAMRRVIIDAPSGAERLLVDEMDKQLKVLGAAIRAAKKAQDDRRVAELEAVREVYTTTKRNLEKVFTTAKNLKAAGYAPLMRFGAWTVTVQAIDPNTGNVLRDDEGEPITEFYGQYETEGEAMAVRSQMEARYKDDDGMRVTAGEKSRLAHELYAGISPETLALFAEAVGADVTMRKYIEEAMSERSALKRRLTRKGTAGYSDDLPRVLSNFITSNGRHAAQRYYLRDLNNAIKYIPKEKGGVKDEAIRLKQFVLNPNDPAAPVSSALFAWFLGGSVAAAMVNLTQPVMMTAPYLSQFGAGTATKALAKALPYVLGKKEIASTELRAALKRASQEGIVDAQEIFHLYTVGAQGVASGLVSSLSRLPVVGSKIKAGSEDARARINAFLTLWGSMFSLAEGFNRKLTFIAAWEVAQANKEPNPYAFAVRAVNETQGIYNKVNRPNWARGPVGRTVLTFKQFSLMYLELLNRMWRRGGPEGKRAALVMLAVLMLAAGEEGLPFAQDLDDLIDTVGQLFGLDTNARRNKRRLAHEILGKHLGDTFLYGISSQLPIDLSGRLGLGNLIPGTGILKPSDEEMRSRNVAEIVGPVAGLGTQIADAYDAAAEGNGGKALQNLAPKAVRDLLAAGEMAAKGYATDAKGRKVVDTDAVDTAAKAIGFNPTDVAQTHRKTMPIQQDIALQKRVESAIVDQWARGVADGDQAMVDEAMAKMERWNRRNPGTPVVIKPAQIRSRVRQMGVEKGDRLIRSAPKEMRGQVGLDLAEGGE